MKGKVLVVEDEDTLREILGDFFRERGFDVELARTIRQGLRASGADVVVLDVRLPDGSGIDAIGRFKEAFGAEVVIITAYEKDAETAVRALRLGAFDYLVKPFKLEELLIVVERAAEKLRLHRECEKLKLAEGNFEGIVGVSAPMREVFEKVKRVAATDIPVLVVGESGTGKELVARTIHKMSGREGSFVAVNCAAIPAELLEAELFGYERGAFTGAASSKAGLIEEAHGGTLFLDEIGDMPLELQGKLLRFLEDGRIRRLGSTKERKVDVRVVSATNKDLSVLMEEGRFREDLYFRVAGFTIEIPPLRRRREDIPLLAEHFLGELGQETGRNYRLSSGALKALLLYDYPGNVRELKNILRQAALMSDGVIMFEHLPESVRAGAGGHVPDAGGVEGKNLEEAVAEFEKSLILQALEKAGGVKKRAAEILGISFRSLRYKLEKYGIK